MKKGFITFLVIAISLVAFMSCGQAACPEADFRFRFIDADTAIEITDYVGGRQIVNIPARINRRPVRSIAARAFANKDLVSVSIPSSVTTIGEGAFIGNNFSVEFLRSIDANVAPRAFSVMFADREWLVLAIEGGRAKLLSRDIVETRRYHSWNAVTWATSEIRAHLNNQFLNTFNADDRGRIVETTILNPNNPRYGTAGGPNTQDRIFLLSIEEAQRYFPDNASRIARFRGNPSWWWLRSPGLHSHGAADVYDDGDLGVNGHGVHRTTGGVRPALWLNL